ncbi:hypothetical protein [Klugiella xanthotipulae]|uniref:hypothetical protein n=1 Tax=Klugiella xanthotipulae TaxID=244735 RepID=UPI00115100C7|nr:hypothetical protein [Klugiella xanthotipulae]
MTFSDMDDALVLTLARAKRVDTLRDVTRVLEPATPIPATCGFWTEGYIPFDAITRGLVVAYALAELTNGVTVVKGLPE